MSVVEHGLGEHHRDHCQCLADPEKSRTTLLTLPNEILEQIASSLHDGWSTDDSDWGDISEFMAQGYTTFSNARFPLSSLSQTCSSVRPMAERALYHSIHLDLSVWLSRQKLSKWAAGSLPLLLRTFRERPELGKLVRCTEIEWESSNIYIKEAISLRCEQGLIQFLNHCPNLKKLVLSEFPYRILPYLPPLSISTLGARIERRWLPFVADRFPALRNLYALRHRMHPTFSVPQKIPSTFPAHRLLRLYVEPDGGDFDTDFSWSLRCCGDSVQQLELRFSDSWLYSTPIQPKPSELPPGAGSALRYVTSNDARIITRPTSLAARLLFSLPSLQHLKISDTSTVFSIPPTAFSILPGTLRSLIVMLPPDAAGAARLIRDLSGCIHHATVFRSITSVTYTQYTHSEADTLSAERLRTVCNAERILFSESQIKQSGLSQIHSYE